MRKIIDQEISDATAGGNVPFVYVKDELFGEPMAVNGTLIISTRYLPEGVEWFAPSKDAAIKHFDGDHELFIERAFSPIVF